jgi:hypothetical protein
VTIDGAEGATRDTHTPPDWNAGVKKLLGSGKAKTLADMMHVKDFGELDSDAHLCAWSMVRFLLDEHADTLAKLLGAVKGQLDEQGQPTGKDLPSLERKVLKDAGGWTTASFDEEWRKWAAKR